MNELNETAPRGERGSTPPPPEHLAVIAAVVAALAARPGGLLIQERRSQWLEGRRPSRVPERECEGCRSTTGRRGALRRTAGDTT